MEKTEYLFNDAPISLQIAVVAAQRQMGPSTTDLPASANEKTPSAKCCSEAPVQNQKKQAAVPDPAEKNHSPQPDRTAEIITFPNGNYWTPTRHRGYCGVNAFYLAAKLLEKNADYYTLVDYFKKPCTDLKTLLELADTLGVYAAVVQVENEQELIALLNQAKRRTAVLHLNAQGEYQENLVCAFLNDKKELAAAGERSDSEMASAWKNRWSRTAMILSPDPFAATI
jgi:hypothetical protein